MPPNNFGIQDTTKSKNHPTKQLDNPLILTVGWDKVTALTLIPHLWESEDGIALVLALHPGQCQRTIRSKLCPAHAIRTAISPLTHRRTVRPLFSVIMI